MTGRPSGYSEELADLICERLVEGESLASICRDEDMPRISTVYAWLRQKPAFLEAYTRARDDQGDTDADKIGDVQNMVLQGLVDPAAARVAIDALKWTAARRQPKKYGDKMALTDGDGGPLQVVVQQFSQPAKKDVDG